MIMRTTLVIDKDITEQEAFERYGTVDPYQTARSLQAMIDSKVTPELKVRLGVETVAVQVVPIGA